MKPKEFEAIYKFTVAPTVPFPSALNWNTEPIGELIRCKDCKYSDTFSDMTAEPHSQLKCLGIRYGGVEPMWYCEHGERKDNG